MTTPDHAAEIQAAETRLAEAQADVARLRGKLADEHAASTAEPAAPRLMSWDDGVAAARKRHPRLQKAADKAAATREAARPQPPGELDGPVARTPAAEYAERHGVDITTVEGAKAAARRRGAARKSSHR
jgi:hypothetical protein